VLGPLVGGFITQYKGWRWDCWFTMILSGSALGLLCLCKETYSPALLQRKAERLRKTESEDRYWSRYDTKLAFGELMKVNLGRPFVMMVSEQICVCFNIYIAVVYGILYMVGKSWTYGHVVQIQRRCLEIWS
jgi:MFS family permease